jgi:hypothetical protein
LRGTIERRPKCRFGVEIRRQRHIGVELIEAVSKNEASRQSQDRQQGNINITRRIDGSSPHRDDQGSAPACAGTIIKPTARESRQATPAQQAVATLAIDQPPAEESICRTISYPFHAILQTTHFA